jgi:hypothetical protein
MREVHKVGGVRRSLACGARLSDTLLTLPTSSHSLQYTHLTSLITFPSSYFSHRRRCKATLMTTYSTDSQGSHSRYHHNTSLLEFLQIEPVYADGGSQSAGTVLTPSQMDAGGISRLQAFHSSSMHADHKHVQDECPCNLAPSNLEACIDVGSEL